MNRGYIRLWRKYQENELWNENRVFSKFEAWLDILTQVQHSHKPTRIIIGMKSITVERGQSIKSLNTWAARWQWSKSKVRRFFNMLKDSDMIFTESVSKSTRLTVINYDTYNKIRNDDETMVKRSRHDDETIAAPDNNVKKDNNENNVNKTTLSDKKSNKKSKSDFINHLECKISESGLESLSDKIKEFFEYRQAKPVSKRYKTDFGINGLFRDLKSCQIAGYDLAECIEIAMERDWQTPDAKYFDNIFGRNDKSVDGYSSKMNNHPAVINGDISAEGAELLRRGAEIAKEYEEEAKHGV